MEKLQEGDVIALRDFKLNSYGVRLREELQNITFKDLYPPHTTLSVVPPDEVPQDLLVLQAPIKYLTGEVSLIFFLSRRAYTRHEFNMTVGYLESMCSNMNIIIVFFL